MIRWEIRVSVYMFLLTDAYPPFSLEDVDYPVRTILPARGPLNRLSVLFRVILAIPAFVFAEIVEYGLTAPLLFVMWIVVIVTGRMPPSLYDAYSSLLRYLARLHAWFSMVTSENAWGMLGDFAPPPPAASPPPLGAVSGSAQSAPTSAAPAAAGAPGRTISPAPAPPPAQPFSYPQAGEQVPTPPPDAVLPPRRRGGRHPSRPLRPEGLRAPCPRPHRGSARPSPLVWSRCPPGESSSCRVRPGPG